MLFEDLVSQVGHGRFIDTIDGPGWTYNEALDAAGRFGSALHQLGVLAGSRVAVEMEKSPEAVLVYLACARLGAVLVPLNPSMTLAELTPVLAQVNPHLFLTTGSNLARGQSLASELKIPHCIALCGDASLDALAAHSPNDAFPPFSGTDDATAVILFTSGTTGKPKGVELTRHGIAANASALAAKWEFSEADTLLHVLPIFHAHGLLIAINTVMAARASILFAPAFDPPNSLKLLSQATVFMGVPTHYARFLQQADLTREAVFNIRLFISGSAPMSPAMHNEFEKRTGRCILERYGMTEALIITAVSSTGPKAAGSVGDPLPGTKVRIRPNSGELASERAVGEIEISSPSRFKTYWRDDARAKADVHEDGYFRTGDLGYLDEAGHLHIVGRAKDLVISGGYNVYPAEIEAAIDALPYVKESAVIGVPHADLGEAVTAFVVAQPGVRFEEPRFLAELSRSVARHKLPRRALLVETLPRNAMGKVLKDLLRQRFADMDDEASRDDRVESPAAPSRTAG